MWRRSLFRRGGLLRDTSVLFECVNILSGRKTGLEGGGGGVLEFGSSRETHGKEECRCYLKGKEGLLLLRFCVMRVCFACVVFAALREATAAFFVCEFAMKGVRHFPYIIEVFMPYIRLRPECIHYDLRLSYISPKCLTPSPWLLWATSFFFFTSKSFMTNVLHDVTINNHYLNFIIFVYE